MTAHAARWLRDIQGVLLDVDGVLYRGRQVLPAAAEFLRFLEAHGIRFIYLTNNSTMSATQYARRLRARGFPATPEQVVGSAEATAYFLRRAHATSLPKLLVVGEAGLRDTLIAHGFSLVDRAEEADAVVVGLDRHATYERLAEAAYALRRGVPYYGTNPDRTFPTERGLAPGAGALLALLNAATDREPVIVGKPERPIFELALQRIGCPPERVLMVGDRLDTDIAGAKWLGLRAALVLTGVTTTPPPPGPDAPDLVVETLGELRHLWEEAQTRATTPAGGQ